jgi:hypothetical protein
MAPKININNISNVSGCVKASKRKRMIHINAQVCLSHSVSPKGCVREEICEDMRFGEITPGKLLILVVSSCVFVQANILPYQFLHKERNRIVAIST